MKCPICKEEIQDQAIKCRWCGRILDQAAYAGLTGNRRRGPISRKTMAITGIALVLLGCGMLFVLRPLSEHKYTASARAKPKSRSSLHPEVAANSIPGFYAGRNPYGFEATLELYGHGKFLYQDPALPSGSLLRDWTLSGKRITFYADGMETMKADVAAGGLNISGCGFKKLR